MAIAFIILYVLCFELTYNIAVHEQIGVTSHISSGWLCWVNRIILLIPAIWYLGIIYGIILWALSIFSIVHATIGWVFSSWVLFLKKPETMFTVSELECSLIIPANIICLIFAIASFFLVKYANAKDFITSNIIIILIVCAVLFVIRLIIEKIVKKKYE